MPDPEFILLGDALWLDFVNTGEGREADAPDRLPDLAAYHRWAKAQKLSSDANIIPLGKLLDLRATLAGLAEVLASGRQAPSSAVEVINEFLAQAAGYFQLIRTQGKWHVQFAPGHSTHASDAIVLSADVRAIRAACFLSMTVPARTAGGAARRPAVQRIVSSGVAASSSTA